MSPILTILIVAVLSFDTVMLFRLIKKFLDFKALVLKNQAEGVDSDA